MAPRRASCGPKDFAFVLLQMLIVVDQHDLVACRNAEDREEADERTERDDVAGEVRGQQAADQRRGQRQEAEDRQPRVVERRQQDQEHADHRGNGKDHHAALGRLPLGILAEHDRVIAQRELDFLEAMSGPRS